MYERFPPQKRKSLRISTFNDHNEFSVLYSYFRVHIPQGIFAWQTENNLNNIQFPSYTTPTSKCLIYVGIIKFIRSFEELWALSPEQIFQQKKNQKEHQKTSEEIYACRKQRKSHLKLWSGDSSFQLLHCFRFLKMAEEIITNAIQQITEISKSIKNTKIITFLSTNFLEQWLLQ